MNNQELMQKMREDIKKVMKAICQKDDIPYNFITCSETQKLASQMTPDSTKTSSLMFGINASNKTRKLNIYDFAGNE